MPSPADAAFHEVGTVTTSINVELSYQIIALFSEGLYSSPNKAIEELVSNAFDADARTVHVALSADRAASGSSIAVIDDGTGMDERGLQVHWIVGQSQKAEARETKGGRRTIGKFGIGKLAAYVLGSRLTHITKANGKYFSTSMDFGRIPEEDAISATEDPPKTPKPRDPIPLDLRTLSAAEAKAALKPWLTTSDGRKDLKLFGAGAAKSWTVAIISDLKPMAQGISAARLEWILSTAMPLRDDFKLYLNDKRVVSSKVKGTLVGSWTLGKDLTTLPKPAPDDLVVEEHPSIKATTLGHYTLTGRSVGPVSGYLEVFESPIDAGKSGDIGRSHGFFVYVHGRLINPEDPGFGIDRNQLRHGTFSRFRLVVNIDRLDEELRSSRETLREGPALKEAKALLQSIFNFARTKLDAHNDSKKPERQASKRLAESPASLTERPILGLLIDAFENKIVPRHVEISNAGGYADTDDFVEHIESRIEAGDGLVQEVRFEDLGAYQPMAVLDGSTGSLSINTEHPFVAHFWDEFSSKENLPLQLFAIAEILSEAQLHEAGVDPQVIKGLLDDRDSLLRHLAQNSGARTSITVAQHLEASATASKELEQALVEAFDQLGYTAIPKGRGDEPDGIAEAFLPARDGERRHYRISLEAKSKEEVGKKVKKKDVEVSTIARHRDEANCQHAIVVGPDFEMGATDEGAVVREILADRKVHEDDKGNVTKTITLMRISDLARLVRLAPVKRLNLTDLRDLFVTCSTANEAAAWVDRKAALVTTIPPYKEILNTLHAEQEADKDATVTYGALRVALRPLGITRSDDELRDDCLALSRMAPDLVFAHQDRVELETRPDKVLDAIADYMKQEPEEPE